MNQPQVYIYPLLLGFLSHLGHHRALSRVPCAIQSVLISYLFYFILILVRHSIKTGRKWAGSSLTSLFLFSSFPPVPPGAGSPRLSLSGKVKTRTHGGVRAGGGVVLTQVSVLICVGGLPLSWSSCFHLPAWSSSLYFLFPHSKFVQKYLSQF